MCLLATSAYAAQMSVDPAYQEVFKGDTITVNITVDPEGSSVYCGSYTLHFNNTILNAISQTRGPFLRQDGEDSTEWWNEIDNTTGKVEYSECRTGTLVGVGDPGVLAAITFQVIGDEGFSGLNISDYNGELLYSTTGSIPADINNGSVEVRNGICGDVDGFPGVTTNDGWLVFMNASKPQGDPRYQLADPWAADCDGFPGITTNDGWLIFMNASKPQGDPRYALACC
jgi:hypothetical protein